VCSFCTTNCPHTRFPGYAWRIAYCECGQHVGWLLTALEQDPSLSIFWGVSRHNVEFKDKPVRAKRHATPRNDTTHYIPRRRDHPRPQKPDFLAQYEVVSKNWVEIDPEELALEPTKPGAGRIIHGKWQGDSVAVTVFQKELIGDAEQWVKQLQMYVNLNYPHLVRPSFFIFSFLTIVFPPKVSLLGACTRKPPYLIVTEDYRETLREKVEREGRLPFPEIQRICSSTLKALAYLHTKRVAYCTLDPKSICFIGHEVKLGCKYFFRYLSTTQCNFFLKGYSTQEFFLMVSMIPLRQHLLLVLCVSCFHFAAHPSHFLSPS